MILSIITPQGVSFEGEVNRFQFPSAKGLMEFLPGHAPMIAEVKRGRIVTDTQEMECGDGVVRIKDDKIVVVCE
jgi:F0F1-type ATP synthase epsilon subunit